MVLNHLVKWVILVLFFLLLTNFFRDSISVEGMMGFGVLLLLIVPINLFTKSYVEANLEIGFDPAIVAEIGMLVILNLFLIYTVSHFIPGIEIEGFVALIMFCIVFSAVSFFVHRIPDLPQIEAFSRQY